MLLLKTPKLYKMIAIAVLLIYLRSPLIKELEMRHVRFNHVDPSEYNYLIDMYFKLEMKYVLEKIIFAHTQGFFNTELVSAA